MTRVEAIKALKMMNLKGAHPFLHWEEMAEVRDMAISALRQQDVTDTNVGKNEPLTLDELRKMGGEPVWVEHYHGGEWITVHWNIYDHIATAYKAELIASEYGERWIAYRRRPKEADHA